MLGHDTASAANNRQTALRLIAEAETALLTPNVVLHDLAQDKTVSGRTAVTTFIRAFFQHAFTDKRIGINTLLADEETVMLSLVVSACQIAPFWGLPNTGRRLNLSLAMICRFQADHIARIELYYDAGTLLRQLGLAL